MSKQVFLVLVDGLARKRALLAMVIKRRRLDPTTFLTNMIRMLLRAQIRRNFDVPTFRPHTVRSSFINSCSLRLLQGYQEVKWGVGFNAGRSCQTNRAVKTTLIVVSMTMMAIAASGCIPILHPPVVLDSSAMGALYW